MKAERWGYRPMKRDGSWIRMSLRQQTPNTAQINGKRRKTVQVTDCRPDLTENGQKCAFVHSTYRFLPRESWLSDVESGLSTAGVLATCSFFPSVQLFESRNCDMCQIRVIYDVGSSSIVPLFPYASYTLIHFTPRPSFQCKWRKKFFVFIFCVLIAYISTRNSWVTWKYQHLH